METTKVNIRELQHNFAMYLEKAKDVPITVTKYGRDIAVIANPQKYEMKEKKKSKAELIKAIEESGVFGMHKDREDWKGRSSTEIARELRRKAWYGE